jgi:protein-disulfide isomerase-like protein with CxxC motif
MPYDPIPTDADLADLVRQLHAKQHPKLITKNLFEMHRLAQGSPLASNPELRADLSDTLEAIVSFLNALPQRL